MIRLGKRVILRMSDKEHAELLEMRGAFFGAWSVTELLRKAIELLKREHQAQKERMPRYFATSDKATKPAVSDATRGGLEENRPIGDSADVAGVSDKPEGLGVSDKPEGLGVSDKPLKPGLSQEYLSSIDHVFGKCKDRKADDVKPVSDVAPKTSKQKAAAAIGGKKASGTKRQTATEKKGKGKRA